MLPRPHSDSDIPCVLLSCRHSSREDKEDRDKIWEEEMRILAGVWFMIWLVLFGYFGHLLWTKLDRIIELLEWMHERDE